MSFQDTMERMPEPAPRRLAELRTLLLQHHKNLLDGERAVYERDVAKIASTGQYLDLVMNDPWFAWLRTLSQFIVEVDVAASSRTPPTDEAAVRLLAEARKLLTPDEAGQGFARRYFEVLQRDPEAVLAHRKVIEALAKL